MLGSGSSAAVLEKINLSDCCFSKLPGQPLSGNYRLISGTEQMSENPRAVNSLCKQSWTQTLAVTRRKVKKSWGRQSLLRLYVSVCPPEEGFSQASLQKTG